MAAFEMIKGFTSASGERHVTVGVGRSIDARNLVDDLRDLGATPCVTQNTAGRRSVIDGRTTRRPVCAASIEVKTRIEEVFG